MILEKTFLQCFPQFFFLFSNPHGQHYTRDIRDSQGWLSVQLVLHQRALSWVRWVWGMDRAREE